MADNADVTPGTGGKVAARSVTYSGDASVQAQVVGLAAFSGADDAKTIVDIGGDATNGLDVDVTRLPRATSGSLASVAGSASSVTIKASNASRVGVIVYNDSSATLYLDLSGGTASTTAFSVRLSPYEAYEMWMPLYTGAITGIWTSATGNARVTEFS